MNQFPIHHDLMARSGEREFVQRVVDDLALKGLTICRQTVDGYEPVGASPEGMVALLMGIDLDAYHEERAAMHAGLTST